MQEHRKQPYTVNCPHCKKPVEWVETNEFRPFCSERCQLIDLGAWAAEEYRIEDPSPIIPNEFEDDLGH